MTVYKKPEDFKVLFLYPNIQMSALAPQSIGYLSAVLKREGYSVRLFDSTFYASGLTTDTNEEKVAMSIVRPFSWKERGIETKSSNMVRDFVHAVEEYEPDLIAVSVVENTWYIATALLEALPKKVPTIVGGVFATYAPEIVIAHPRVDYCCRGEGEIPLAALCEAMAEGRDTTKIPNLYVKEDGRIHRNPIGQALTMDELPFPDWDIFEPQSMFRPMQGRVYKTIGVETQRGCPYSCTFCNSPSNNILYDAEHAGRFHRKKSVKRVAEELEYMVKTQGPEFIYFVVDTFLAMGSKEFDEFSEMYQSFKIPFWMNTRAETVTEHRADHLELMNCLRMNIGIEHGNEEYRAKVLKRKVTNKKMLEAFDYCAGRSFVTVANSIIGMPDETRDLVFDTIALNRQLPKEIEASGAFIFTPFHGTPLRQYAIDKGYIEDGSICSLNVTKGSVLNMPQFSSDEIQGLCRTFSFYVKMDDSRWDDIRLAEQMTPEGEARFVEIRDEFQKAHRPSSVDPKDSSSFDLVIGSDEWEKGKADKPALTGDMFSDLH